MSSVPGSGPSIDVKYDSARIYVPGWWIHAFERSQSQKNEVTCPDPGVDALPLRLDASEWSVLALVLGQIQKQVFCAKEPAERIEIAWSQLVRLLSSSESTAVERLLVVFESLPRLRFLVRQQDGSFAVVPLFENERWYRGAEDVDIKLTFTVAERGYEILSGYLDGHLDLLGRMSGQSSLSSINNGNHPLVLWTAIWLELGAVEQVVYTRMESAMQSQGSWLRLDGLVGLSLEKLTTGLKVGTKKSPAHTILDRLRLVVKLGRRLVAHGLIQREPSTQFMALTPEFSKSSPTIMWQASSERLRSRDESEYFGMVSSRIFNGPVRSRVNEIIQILGALSGDAEMATRLRDYWGLIAAIPGGAAQISPGVLAQAHLLFLEWIARLHPLSQIPLPPRVLAMPFISELRSVRKEFVEASFRNFTRKLAGIQDLFQDFDPKQPPTISHPGFTDLSALVIPAAKTPEKKNFALPPNRIPVKQDSFLAKKTDQNQFKLRKIAQDELDKMMRQSPRAYADLKQKFLASLEGEIKDLVMDAQRRLGSKDLDRHLKTHIVKYMVEHPGAWQSVSPSPFS